MERLEWLWQQASEALQDARAAMRVHKDQNGKIVFDGRDFAAITTTLNQAHRNVELLGKATGAFTDQPNVDLQIVTPICLNVSVGAGSVPLPQAQFCVSPADAADADLTPDVTSSDITGHQPDGSDL